MNLPVILQRFGFIDHIKDCYDQVSLTHAQLTALSTTRVQIAAAPGANKILLPYVAIVEANFSAGAYAEDRYFQIYWKNQTGDPLLVSAAGVTNAAADVVSFMPEYWSAEKYAKTSAVNAALEVALDNTLSGGDAANTARVTVFYWILDLS